MTKNQLCRAVAAALVLASGASNVAWADVDTEPNDSATSTQRLVIDASRSAQVTGTIGVLATVTPVIPDVDYFSFHGRAGDVVTVDIDGGMKPAGSSTRSLDSVLAIFAPDLSVLRQIDDVPSNGVDAGSISRFDARLDNVVLPVTGVYTVGVASSGRVFLPGGTVTAFVARSTSNGSYTLIISGVTPSVQQIGIEIKPGAGSIAPLNPKSRGNVPVALLSSADFDALKADRSSITFGSTGDERSLLRCGKEGEDVNRDGRPDLVCHFDNQAASFDQGDEEGIVRGNVGGMPFEGRGWLKIVPVKRDN